MKNIFQASCIPTENLKLISSRDLDKYNYLQIRKCHMKVKYFDGKYTLGIEYKLIQQYKAVLYTQMVHYQEKRVT